MSMKNVFAAALCGLALASCSGGGGGSTGSPLPSTPQAPQPMPTSTTYVALGDSVTYGDFADDPQTQGYATRVASVFHLKLDDLAIPGAGTFAVISRELPNMPQAPAAITLFIGYNNVAALAPQSATSVVGDPTSTEAQYASDMNQIANTLRLTGSQVYIATVPNIANLAPWTTKSQDVRQTLSDVTKSMNETIMKLGLPVVDLRCDPGMYDPSNYYNGVHPNTQGHAYLAGLFFKAMTGQIPVQSSCKYDNPV